MADDVRALRDLDEILILANVKHVLQGSAAAILHGAAVSVAPGDLDMCVDNLAGILLRPEIRPKEIEAFNSLILLKRDSLSPTERDLVFASARRFSEGRVKNWEEVLQLAQEANLHFKMGI